jgi:hypothetical protein
VHIDKLHEGSPSAWFAFSLRLRARALPNCWAPFGSAQAEIHSLSRAHCTQLSASDTSASRSAPIVRRASGCSGGFSARANPKVPTTTTMASSVGIPSPSWGGLPDALRVTTVAAAKPDTSALQAAQHRNSLGLSFGAASHLSIGGGAEDGWPVPPPSAPGGSMWSGRDRMSLGAPPAFSGSGLASLSSLPSPPYRVGGPASPRMDLLGFLPPQAPALALPGPSTAPIVSRTLTLRRTPSAAPALPRPSPTGRSGPPAEEAAPAVRGRGRGRGGRPSSRGRPIPSSSAGAGTKRRAAPPASRVEEEEEGPFRSLVPAGLGSSSEEGEDEGAPTARQRAHSPATPHTAAAALPSPAAAAAAFHAISGPCTPFPFGPYGIGADAAPFSLFLKLTPPAPASSAGGSSSWESDSTPLLEEAARVPANAVLGRVGAYAYALRGGAPGGTRARRLEWWSTRRLGRNWSKEAMVRYPHRAGIVKARMREQGRFR